MKRLTWFFGVTRLGRWVTIHLHPIVHRGIVHPFRFQEGGCWLCRLVTRSLLDDATRDAQADQSSIVVSEPEFTDGKVTRRGITMSATAKRQMEELFARDPGAKAAIEKALAEIAEHPEP